MLTVLLAPGSLNHTANIIKGFAIAIGVAIAIGFVWMWWAHRLRERRQELAARARNVYASHLRQTLQYPELADPTLGAVRTPAEAVRYKQFVAGLLNAVDEVLLLNPSDQWRSTIGRQLFLHRAYLASDDFRRAGLDDCTPEIKALIQKVISAPAAA